MSKIHKIVLTGGPCGGKTSALAYLTVNLENMGYKVITVPEAATIVLSSIIREDFTNVEIQKMIFQKSLELEAIAHKKAKEKLNQEEVVIIFDRGILDAKAYIDKEEFVKLLKHFSMSEIEILKRYDSIFHLVTAADGAKEHYTNENNSARKETIEEAIALDKKTMNSWCGHSKISVIENTGTFQEKLETAFTHILSSIGNPAPLEIERKYLFLDGSVDELLKDSVEFQIEQTYLTNQDGHAERVRKITADNILVYYHTTKKKITQEYSVIEEEKKITKRKFIELLKKRDITRHTIIKKRFYKFFEKKYFSIDIYISPNINKIILEIEFSNHTEAKNFQLPVALTRKYKIIEVSGSVEFSNYHISKTI